MIHPDDAAARAIEDGALVRVWNDRGAFDVVARVSDDTRQASSPRRWAGGTATTRAAGARRSRPSQRLTTLGAAPIFNDNRVDAAPL